MGLLHHPLDRCVNIIILESTELSVRDGRDAGIAGMLHSIEPRRSRIHLWPETKKSGVERAWMRCGSVVDLGNGRPR